MELNGWTIKDNNAVHRAALTTPEGETTIIMMAVCWEDNPEDLLRSLNAIPTMVDELKPGLTIRVMIDGEPLTVIPTNAAQGEDQSLEAFTKMNRAEDILESILQAYREPDQDDPPTSRMKINHSMETDYPVADILEWPGTPTQQRHLATMEFLEHNPSLLNKIEKEIIEEALGRNSQASRDVFNLIGITMSNHFGLWAIDQLVKQGVKSWHESHELIELLAWKGSSRSTIGTAINTKSDDRNDENSEVFGFTWMQRDPDWMGFCVNLKEMKGAQILVMESSTGQGKPGIVMASTTGHPNTPRFEKATDRFPPEREASTLRDIITWHGAKECLWLPAE